MVFFIRCTRGAMGLTFAIMLPLLAAASLGGMEYTRAVATKLDMQKALDSAVLIAIKRDEAIYRDQLDKAYDMNLGVGAITNATRTVRDDIVNLAATAEYDIPILQIIGFDTFKIRVHSAAEMKLSTETEGSGYHSDFEHFESWDAGTPTPPVDFGGVTVTFSNFFVVEAGNRVAGFWGDSEFNVVKPEFRSVYSGKSITLGRNTAAAYNTGVSVMEFSAPVANLTFSVADLEDQFMRPGDYIKAFDASGALLENIPIRPTTGWTPSGEVINYSFDVEGITKIEIKSQDPFGLDNMRFEGLQEAQPVPGSPPRIVR